MPEDKQPVERLPDILARIANCLEIGDFSTRTPATKRDASTIAGLICANVEDLTSEENRRRVWLLHAAKPDGFDQVNFQQTFNERSFRDWLGGNHRMQAATLSALMFWFLASWGKKFKARRLGKEVKATARSILELSHLPAARLDKALKEAIDELFGQRTKHLETLSISHRVDTIRENKAPWLRSIQGLYRVYRHRSDEEEDRFVAELFQIDAPNETAFGFFGTYYEYGRERDDGTQVAGQVWECSGFADNDLLHTSMSTLASGNRVIHEQMQIVYPGGPGAPVMCGIRVGLTDINAHLGVSIVLFERLAASRKDVTKVAGGTVRGYAQQRKGVFAINPENALHKSRHKALNELFAEAERSRLILKKNTVFDFDAADIAKDFANQLGTDVGNPLNGEAPVRSR